MSISEAFTDSNKHIGLLQAPITVAQVQHTVTEKLQLLSLEKLLSVLDFVEFISQSLPTRPPAPSPLPEPTAFLECAGTWQFAPGELEAILSTVDQVRNLDLEGQDAHISSLFA